MYVPLVFLLIGRALAGVLRPSAADCISVTSTNAGQTSRYQFSFLSETGVLEGGSVAVQFPLQYPSGLGLANCVGESVSLDVRRSVPCSVAARTVTWEVGTLDIGPHTLSISSVQNPATPGATSVFSISSHQSGFTRDENESFGSVAVSPAAVLFSLSSLSVEGSLAAGHSPVYRFTATTAISLRAGTWLRVTFPLGFTVTQDLDAGVEEWGATLRAEWFEKKGTVVALTGMTREIAAATKLTFRVTGVKTPSVTGATGTFLFEALREGTFTTLQTSVALAGVTVTAGEITAVQVMGGPLILNLKVMYTIMFTTLNGVPEGGSISVTFPEEFNGCTACQAQNGLTPTGASVKCSATGNVVVFSAFRAVSAGVVSVSVTAKNPASVVTTSNFQIATYAPTSAAIDQNSQAGTLTFTTINTPSAVSVDLFTSKVEAPIGSYGPIDLFLQTRSTLPATTGANVGRIVVTLPAATQLPAGIAVPADSRVSCLFGKGKVPAARCDWAAGPPPTVTIDTPANSDFDQCPLAITISTIGNPTATSFGFMLPTTTGTGAQTINVKVFVNNVGAGQHVEEANIAYVPQPKDILSSVGATAGAVTVTPAHYTNDAWNVLSISLKPSITVPVGSTLEFEFPTFQHDSGKPGWPRDLGWGAKSYESQSYPCFHQAGGFSACVVVAGTTLDSAFVRLTGSTAALSAGTAYWFWLPKVRNGKYPGAPLTLTVRSKLATGEVLEYNQWTSASLLTEANKSFAPGGGSSITAGGGNVVDDATTTHAFSVASGLALGSGDWVIVYYPKEYKWTPAASSLTATGVFAGVSSYLFQQTEFSALVLQYTAAAASPQTFTLNLPLNALYSPLNPTEILVVKSSEVQYYTSLYAAAAPAAAIFTAVTGPTELLPDSTISLKFQKGMYSFAFTTSKRVTKGGSISVLFPATEFSAVDSTCYQFSLTPTVATAQCKGESGVAYGAGTYHRFLISNIAPTSSLSPACAITLIGAVTTAGTAGPLSITVISNDEDTGTSKVINSSVLSLPVTLSAPLAASFSSPFSAPTPLTAKSDFASPAIEMRAGEFGELRVTLSPLKSVPASTTLQNGYIRISLPANGYAKQGSATLLPGTFTKAAGAFLECRLNGVMASRCDHTVPTQIDLYTPTSVPVAAGSVYTVSVTARDATVPSDIGFQAPATAGFYQFIIGTYVLNAAVPSEQAEVWVYVPPARFTSVAVTSINKAAGAYTALFFDFKAATAINPSTHATAPGVIFLEFPYGASAWASDLGSGVSPGGALDCVDMGSTASLLAALTPATFLCYLEQGNIDYTRIRIENFNAVSSGDQFKFAVAGIANPTAALVDFRISIASFTYDKSVAAAPYWQPKDYAEVTYIDTTMTNPNSWTSDSDPAVIAPTTVSTATQVTLNLKAGTPAVTTSDYALVKVPPQFTIPRSFTTKTVGGSAASLCYGFPFTSWVLVKLASAIASGGTAALVLADAGLVSPQDAVAYTFTTYMIADRKTSFVRTHSVTPTTKTCTISNVDVDGSLYTTHTSTYRIKFTCVNTVPVGGLIVVSFPAAYTGIKAKTCSIGPESAMTEVSLSCVLVSTVNLQLKGWTTAITGGTVLQVQVDTANPAVASYSTWGVSTYSTSTTSNPINTVATSPTVAVLDKPTATWATQFEAGTLSNTVMYASTEPVRSGAGDNKTGPLTFTVTANTATLAAGTGYMEITVKKVVAINANAEMRCVWKTAGVEYLAADCTLAASVVTMYAPKDRAIAAGTAYQVTITTVNSDNEEGLIWSNTQGVYPVDIKLVGTATETTRVFAEIYPEKFKRVTVAYDHRTAGQRNRFIIKIDNSANVVIKDYTQGYRIVVEFPIALFAADLGYYGSDNKPVSCLSVGSTAGTTFAPKSPYTKVKCYILTGDSATGQNPLVVVTGFDTMNASATNLEIHLDKVKNPVSSGSDKRVWVQVYVLDVSAGWPGTKVVEETVENVFTVDGAAPTTPAALAAPAISVVAVQDITATYSFVNSAPAAWGTTDFYYVELDSKLTTAATVTSTNAAAGSFYYYPDSNSLILTPTASPNVVTGINNLDYELNSPLVFVGYSIQSGLMKYTSIPYTSIALPTYTRSTLAVAPTIARADGVATALYKSDTLDFIVAFTTGATFPIPKTGGIHLIAGLGATFPEQTCFNDDLGGSQLSFSDPGFIECSGSTTSLVIKGFDLLLGGKAVKVRVKVAMPAVNWQFEVNTLYSAGATATIMQASGAVAVTVAADTAHSYHEVPLQLHFPKVVRYQDYASFSFFISNGAAITANGFVTIVLPAGVTAGSRTLLCLWGGVEGTPASSCTESPASTFTIKAPALTPVLAALTEVVITTQGSTSISTQGLYWNAAVNDYSVTVSIDSTGGGGTLPTTTETLSILPQAQFTSLVVTGGHATAGKVNYFRVKATLAAGVDTALKVCFPTVDRWGNALFADDLGTGLKDTEPFPCHPDGTVLPANTVCTLYVGEGHVDRPACIKLTGFTALVSTNIPIVTFDNIVNPSSYGSDDRHVDISVYAYNGGSAGSNVNQFQVFYDVLTVGDATAWAASAPAAPTFSVTTTNAATVLSVDLSGSSCVAADDTNVILFPSDFKLSGTTCAGCEIHTETNWVIVTGSCSATYAINLPATAVTANPLPANRVLTGYLHQKDTTTGVYYLKTTATYAAFAALTGVAGAAASVFPAFPTGATTFSNSKAEWFITDWKPTVAIPTGSCIKFTFNLPLMGGFCTSSYEAGSLTPGTGWSCTVSGSTATVVGFAGTTAATTNIRLLVRASPNANFGTANAESYADSGCSTQIIEIQSANNLYNAELAATALSAFAMGSAYQSQSTAKQGETCEIAFLIKPTTAVTQGANNYVEVGVENAFTLSAGATLYCETSGTSFPAVVSPTVCSYSGTTIKVYPQATIAAGSFTRIRITTIGANSSNNGLVLANSNTRNRVTVTTYLASVATETGVFDSYIPSDIFTTLTIAPLHVKAAVVNYLTIGVKMVTALTSAHVILVEFPSKTKDLAVTLFADDLGTSSVTRTPMPCTAATATGTADCRLLKGSATSNVPPAIQITNLSCAASTAFTLYVGGFANPTVSTAGDGDRYIVDLKVSLLTSAGVVVSSRVVEGVYALSTAAYAPSAVTVNWAGGSSVNTAATNLQVAFTADGTYSTVTDIVLIGPSTLTLTYAGRQLPNGNAIWFTGAALTSPQSAPLTTPIGNAALTGFSVLIVGKTATSKFALGAVTAGLATTALTAATTVAGAAALYPTGAMVGMRGFVDLKLTATAAVPVGLNIKLAFTGISNLDAGFAYPFGFVDSDAANVRWSISGTTAVVWGYKTAIPNASVFGLRVFGLLGAAPGATFTLCSDAAATCTNVYATNTATAASPAAASAIQSSNRVSVSVNQKSGTSSPTFTAIWQPDTALTVATNSGITLDLTFDATLIAPGTGSVGTCTLAGNSCGGTGTTYNSGAMFGELATATAVTSAWTIVMQAVGASLTAPGYAFVLVKSVETGTAAKQAVAKLLIEPSSQFASSSIDSFTYSPSVKSIIHAVVSLNTNLATGQFIAFQFSTEATANDGFLGDLGLGRSGGDDVPYYTASSGVAGCWLSQGGAGLSNMDQGTAAGPAAIVCATNAAVSSLDIYFPLVTTPVTTGKTPSFSILTYKYSSGAFTYIEYRNTAMGSNVQGSQCSTGAASNLFPTLSDVLNTNTYSITLNTGGTNTQTNDYFLLKFAAGFEFAGLTAGTNTAVVGVVVTPSPCPCLLLKYTGATSTTSPVLQLTNMPNPVFAGSFTFDVYSLLNTRAGWKPCPSAQAFNFGTITKKTGTAGSISNLNSPSAANTFYRSEDSFMSVSVTTLNPIPKDGAIKFSFSNTVFDAVSGFHATLAGVTDDTNTYRIATDATNGSNYEVTFTRMGSVAASTLITVSGVYSPIKAAAAGAAFSVVVSTYYDSAATKQIDEHTVASPTTITTSPTAFLAANFLLPWSTLFRPYRVANGAATSGTVVHYFQTPTALTVSTNATPGSIELNFASDVFKAGTNARYFAVFTNTATGSRYLSFSVSRSGSYKITIATPNDASVASGVLWRLELSANNGDTDGITLDDGVVAQSWDYKDGTNTYSIYGAQVTSGKSFPQLAITSANNNGAGANLLEVVFTAATAIATGAEVVVEFPLVQGLSATALFAADLGSGASDGAAFNCAFAAGGTVQTGTQCRLQKGDATSLLTKLRDPVKVVVSAFGAIATGTTYSLAVGGITNPAALTVSELRVYTQQITAGTATRADYATIKDYAVCEGAVVTTTKTPTASTPATPSLSVTTTGSTSDYTFTFTPSSSVDFLIFVFPPSVWDTSTWWSAAYPTTTTGNVQRSAPSALTGTVYSLPQNGWIVLKFASVQSVTAVAVKQVKNLGYVPTAATYKVTGYACSAGVNIDTYSFTHPTALTASAMSALSATTLSGLFIQNYIDTYTFQFTLTNKIGTNGAVKLTFPAEFGTVGTRCWGSSSAFGKFPTCAVSGSSWTLTLFKGASAGATIKMWGAPTHPAATGTTSYFVIKTFNDVAETLAIDSSTTQLNVVIASGTRIQTPSSFYLPIQVNSNRLLVRSQDYAPVTFVVKPATDIVAATDSVKFTPTPATKYVGTTTAPNALTCKFIDYRTSPYRHYKSPKCSYAAGVFTALAPTHTNIVATKKWMVSVYMLMKEGSGMGVQHPDYTTDKTTTWQVEHYSGATLKTISKDVVQTVPTLSMSAVTVTPVSLSPGFANVWKVAVTAAMTDFSTGKRFAVVFPALDTAGNALFTQNLGTSYYPGKELNCDVSGVTALASTTVGCRLKQTFLTNNAARDYTIELTNHASSASASIYFYIPKVLNPATQWQVLSLTLEAYTYNAGLFELSDKVVLWGAFSTSTTVALTAKTYTSYMSALATTDTVAAWGSTVAIAFAPESLAPGDYIILQFSVALAAASTVVTYIEARFLSLGMMLVKNTSGAAISTVSLSSFTNPQYFDPTPTYPTLSGYIVNSSVAKYSAAFSASIANYTPEPFSAAITMSQYILSPTAALLHQNVREDLYFTFQTNRNIPAGGGFAMVFPASYVLDYRCWAVSVNGAAPSGSDGGLVPCFVSGQTAFISNLSAYTASQSIAVLVWAKSTATGTTSVTVSSCWSNPYPACTQLAQQKTYSLVATGTAPPAVAALQSPVLRSARRNFMLSDGSTIKNYATLTFLLKPSVAVPADIGIVTISLGNAILDTVTVSIPPAPRYARCLWTNTSTMTVYMGKDCTVTSGTPDVVVATAPVDQAISTAVVWQLSVTATMDSYHGLTLTGAPAAQRYFVKMQSSAGDFQGAYWFLQPQQPQNAVAKGFCRGSGHVTLLEFSIKPSVNVAASAFPTAGSSELILRFDGSIFAVNLGSSRVSTTDYTKALDATDCSGNAAIAGLKCYIRRGDSGNDPRPEVWVRGHSALTAGVTATIDLAPVWNPSAIERIVHIDYLAREYTAGTWTYKQYTEFRYIYMTENQTPTTQSSVAVTYGALTPSTTTTLDFTAKTAATLTTAGRGALLLFLSESDPLVTGTVTTYGSFSHTVHNVYVVLTNGGSIADGGTVSFTGVKTPSVGGTLTWTGFALQNGVATTDATYTVQTTVAYTASPLSLSYLTDIVGASHLASRSSEYILTFSPTKSIPSGGSIVLTPPSSLVSADKCRVRSGLTGGVVCQPAGGSTYFQLTGFSAYNPALSPPYIVIEVWLTAQATAAASGNLSVKTYGVAGSAGTIMDDLTVATAAIVLSQPLLAVTVPKWQRPQTPACAGDVGTLTVKLQPRVNYGYTNIVEIKVQGITAPAGVVECRVGLAGNSVPSEQGCTWSSPTVTIKVPEQLAPLLPANTYTLTVTFRDSGTLPGDGYTLPTITTISGAGYYGQLRAFLNMKTAGGVATEQGKFGGLVCAPAFTSMSVTPVHSRTSSPSFFDITFTPSVAVAAGAVLVVEFPTHNEVAAMFDKDLGLGLLGTTATASIDCAPTQGFAAFTAGTLVCTLYQAASQSSASPAIIKVTNHGGIAAAAANSIRFVGVTNPRSAVDGIFALQQIAHFHVYFQHTATPDAVTYNENWDYRVFAETGSRALTSTSPTTYNTATATVVGVTTTNTGISGANYMQFTFGAGSATVSNAGGTLIFVLDAAFTLATSGSVTPLLTCSNFATSCIHRQYSASNWVVTTVTGGSTTTASTSVQFTNLNSPEYTQTGGYSVAVYVVTAAGLWSETHTAALATMTASTFTAFTVTNTLGAALLNTNTYDIYTVTIDPQYNTSRVKRIDIIFPAQYQWTDAVCRSYTGVGQTATNVKPVSCVSDCSSVTCTNRVSVTNFSIASATGTYTVTIGAMNPAASGATGSFQGYFYASETDTSLVLEQQTTLGAQTIKSQTYPWDAWVEWTTIATSDRQLREKRAGNSGEVWVRMMSRVGIPRKTGQVKVAFPVGFDISAGRSPQCTVSYGSNPFATFPLQWAKPYLHPLSPLCLWENRAVTVLMPDLILREWDNVSSQCFLMRLTTTGVVTAPEGFTAPDLPGWYSSEVTTSDASYKTLEKAYANVYIPGVSVPTSGFTVSASMRDVGLEAIYSVTFTTDRVIPRGFSYFVNNVQAPQGFIEFSFETYQSFSPDLGLSYTTGSSVLCYIITGLKVSVTGSLSCTFTAGDTSLTTPSRAVITITGFDEIAADTQVQVDFPRIKNPATAGYKRTVYVSVYTLSPAGRRTDIYTATQPSVPLSTAAASVSAVGGGGGSFTPTDRTIDATAAYPLPLTVAVALSAGDLFIVSFPAQFTTIPSSITATLKSAGGVVLQAVMPVAVYSAAGIVRVTNAGAIVAGAYVLSLGGVRNPGYLDTCTLTCQVTYFSVTSSLQAETWNSGTNGVFTDLSLIAAAISTPSLFLSSLQANAVNVALQFNFLSGAQLPVGAVVTFSMHSAFPLLANSAPVPTCTGSVGVCSVSADSAVVTLGSVLASGSAVRLSISGLRNPINTGTYTGFALKATTASGKTIFTDALSAVSVTITTAADVAYAVFSFIPDYYTANISTLYTLSFTVGVKGFPGTHIIVSLPGSYNLNAGITCSVLFGIAISTPCSVLTASSFELVLKETVTELNSVKMVVAGIKSPPIPTSANFATFSPLRLSVYHDSVLLSQSSDFSESAKITLYRAVTEMLKVESLTVLPTNEAEYATYTFVLNVLYDIPMGNSTALLVRFPSQYMKTLIPYDIPAKCSSDPPNTICGVGSSRELTYSGFTSAIPSGYRLTLTVFGILNPIAGVTGQFAFYLVNTAARTVLAFAETGTTVKISALAPALIVNYVNVTDTHAGSKCDYTFSFATGGSQLPANTSLWIDWPESIRQRFLAPNYLCTLSTTLNTPYCEWLAATNYKRTQVTGIASFSAYNGDISVQVFTLPTPFYSGDTAPFVLRLVDLSTGTVLFRSYEVLDPRDTVEFSSGNFSVEFVDFQFVNVTRGTYSGVYSLRLGRAAYDIVHIFPMSDNSLITADPRDLRYQFAWNTTAQFRIGVPLAVFAGNYLMQFAVSEEGTRENYGIVSDVLVTVADPGKRFAVKVGELPDIEEGYTCAPVNVTLEVPVFDGLLLTFSSTLPGLTFTPSYIRFGQGEQWKTFTISAAKGAASGFITYSLSGESFSAYFLSATTVPYTITSPSPQPISVLSVRITEIQRTSAKVHIVLSGLGIVYYALNLRSAAVPSSQEIYTQSWERTALSPQYGSLATTGNSRTARFVVSGLVASMQYSVYVVAINAAGALGEVPTTTHFATLSNYPPAKFRMVMTEIVSVQSVIIAVAQTLALPESLILFIGTDPSSYMNGGRKLQGTNIVIYDFAIYLKADIAARPPIEYVGLIEERKEALKSALPQLSTVHSISQTIEELVYTKPRFPTPPAIVALTNTTVTVQAQQNVAGRVYAVLLSALPAAPLSQQIRLGLDPSNSALPSARVQAQPCVYKSPVVFQFANLTTGEQYVVWLTGENDLPGEPDIMRDDELAAVNFTAGMGVSQGKGVLVMMQETAALSSILAVLLLA